jgi:hypothetical protein
MNNCSANHIETGKLLERRYESGKLNLNPEMSQGGPVNGFRWQAAKYLNVAVPNFKVLS